MRGRIVLQQGRSSGLSQGGVFFDGQLCSPLIRNRNCPMAKVGLPCQETSAVTRQHPAQHTHLHTRDRDTWFNFFWGCESLAHFDLPTSSVTFSLLHQNSKPRIKTRNQLFPWTFLTLTNNFWKPYKDDMLGNGEVEVRESTREWMLLGAPHV